MPEISYKLSGRMWIEIADEKILGHGRIELLQRIKASGSIRQAALQMKMSYKQAWDLIKHMNEKFASPLVISHRGGKGGGHAEITETGLKVMAEFDILQAKFDEFLRDNSQNLQF